MKVALTGVLLLVLLWWFLLMYSDFVELNSLAVSAMLSQGPPLYAEDTPEHGLAAPAGRHRAIPFVPCECSDPAEGPNTLDCAVEEDDTVGGGRALSTRQLDVDGLVTRRDYISSALQQRIIATIEGNPWGQYSGKTVQEYGQNFTFYSPTPTSLSIPPPFQEVAMKLVEEGLVDATPNYVLVNRYSPGQGIHAHTDEPYFDDGIASLTLKSGAAVMFFRDEGSRYYEEDAHGRTLRDKYRRNTPLTCAAGYFAPGSIFVMKREARYAYKHEMVRREADAMVYASAPPSLPRGHVPLQTRRVILPRQWRYAATFRRLSPQVIREKYEKKLRFAAERQRMAETVHFGDLP